MEGEFTGASAQTMGAADVAGQQSGQEAAAQAQVQQQPVNVPDAQGQGTQEETFDSLIRGRYKQDFDSAVQKVVKQRVRGLNQYKGQAEAMAPIIDQLGALYGIDTSDPRKTDFAALAQRFSADERLYSAEAMEKGHVGGRHQKGVRPAGPRIRPCGGSCRSTRCEKPLPGSRQTLPGM